MVVCRLTTIIESHKILHTRIYINDKDRVADSSCKMKSSRAHFYRSAIANLGDTVGRHIKSAGIEALVLRKAV
jgi:hypothetical protein